MTDLMEMEVTGRNLAEGLPRKLTISSKHQEYVIRIHFKVLLVQLKLH